MRTYQTIIAVALIATIAGCRQTTTYREYFPPTEATTAIGADGLARGAVAKEISKDGSPDWSEGSNKFNANISFIGM
ncbi:MAG: hypothetical protein ACRC3H_12210 [Lachnospiraceae bacterium]